MAMLSAQSCPRCRTPVMAGMQACPRCGLALGPSPAGYRQQAPAPTPGYVPMTGRGLCYGCGFATPQLETSCPVCRYAFGRTPPRAPVPEQDNIWVAVRCQFQCSSCGHLSPLDYLDTDGSVRCIQCGLDQAFDVSSWTQALNHAHAVGDLAGPDPEGRFPHPLISIYEDNPFIKVGETEAFAEDAQSGMATVGAQVLRRSLQIQAGPGYPICKKCHVPLNSRLLPDGQLATVCTQCGDQGRYALPPEARKLAPTLIGAICEEGRVDRPRVRQGQIASGAVAIVCPSCGGPLSLRPGQSIVNCPYCNTSALVPQRLMARSDGQPVEAQVWWLLFRGPSLMRKDLEVPRSKMDEVNPRLEELAKASGKSVEKIRAKLGTAFSKGDVMKETVRGIEEAPEVKGFNVRQLLLSLALSSVAGVLVVGVWVLYVLLTS